MRLVDDENTGLDIIGREVEKDPALAARIMKVANSPFYAVHGKLDSIWKAVGILGLSNTRAIVTAAIIMSRMPAPGKNTVNFWQKAFMVAVAARVIASDMSDVAGGAFTTGLLHDIGELLLAAYFPDKYSEIKLLVSRDHWVREDAEKQVMGMLQTEVGAVLAEAWHYPEYIVEAIRSYRCPDKPSSRLVYVIHIAKMISEGLSVDVNHPVVLPRSSQNAWKSLAMSREKLHMVVKMTWQQSGAMSNMLR